MIKLPHSRAIFTVRGAVALDKGGRQQQRRQRTLLSSASESDRAFMAKVDEAKREADEESVSSVLRSKRSGELMSLVMIVRQRSTGCSRSKRTSAPMGFEGRFAVCNKAFADHW